MLYVGQHSEYGDTITVSPAVARQRPQVSQALFDEGYITFYPARAAVAQNLAMVVGHLPAPPLPSVLRRPGARSGRNVETWIIEDESGETVMRTLGEQERHIPIAAIWNHEFLVQRIAEGWRPEREGDVSDERVATGDLTRESKPDRPRLLLHYLYFPEEAAARAAAGELRRQGFGTEERLGGDGVNWLVLARHEIVFTEAAVQETRRLMESIVRLGDGEYDGWEVDVT